MILDFFIIMREKVLEVNEKINRGGLKESILKSSTGLRTDQEFP